MLIIIVAEDSDKAFGHYAPAHNDIGKEFSSIAGITRNIDEAFAAVLS